MAFAPNFVKDAVERAVRTFTQVVLGFLGAEHVLGLQDVDWPTVLSAGGLATLISVLMSVSAATWFGEPGTASTVD